MHELGIVMHVERVLKLTLEVGEVSSIVPELFTECFEWAKKKTELLKDTELELILLEAVSYCRDCKKTYKTTEHAKECPHCGGNDTYPVTGNEMNIKDMEVV